VQIAAVSPLETCLRIKWAARTPECDVPLTTLLEKEKAQELSALCPMASEPRTILMAVA